MKEFDNNSAACKDAGDVVSFIYGEMPEDERELFENHLLDCEPCTVEIESLSDARFSVIEWRQDAFDGLAVPQISIPYARPAVAADAEPGFIEKTWATLFGGRGLSLAASMAVITVLLFGGIAGFYLLRNAPAGNDQAAGSNSNAEIAANRKPEPTPTVVRENVSPVAPDPADTETTKAVTTNSGVKPLVTKAADRRTNRTQRPAPRMPMVAGTGTKAPKLSATDEDEDDGLRLSDLFDQVDTR
ncbi:MAG: zf-HC2 domain-containing protein [Pyrinomonadaceae bacterium]|nr:zf-HC2 domain-containing protein [Pyrinomonadaceae bacterium]MBP6213882.1 zf-HC2 domain-containing protein [Pyrinomonadaceae bacterium]